MAYPPPENRVMVGDLHPAALVGTAGTLDPPGMFCSILDKEKGEHFELEPEGHGRNHGFSRILTRLALPGAVNLDRAPGSR